MIYNLSENSSLINFYASLWIFANFVTYYIKLTIYINIMLNLKRLIN